MTLQARLDRIRENFEKDAPQDALEIMHQATANLRTSGIMDGVAKEGQRAPDFTLDSLSGTGTSLASLLADGPLMLTFYRGDW